MPPAFASAASRRHRAPPLRLALSLHAIHPVRATPARYVYDFLEGPLKQAFPHTSMVDARLSPSTAPLTSGMDAVCLFVNDDASAETVEILAANGTRLIAMRCAGYDRVDVDACRRHGVTVARVPEYSPHAVAEHALALLMAVNRHLPAAHSRTREGNFTLSGLVGVDLYGKTAGVVGTGKIGRCLIRILRGLGMRVLAHDVAESPEARSLGAEYVERDYLIANSDVISLHAPLMDSTRHMIDRRAVELMRPGCLIVNVARGGLIDTAALLQGLKSGQVGGAALDTYEKEDKIFFKDFSSSSMSKRMEAWDDEFKLLKAFPNVLITPHSAFLTREALANIANSTVANVLSFAEGKPFPENALVVGPGKN